MPKLVQLVGAFLLLAGISGAIDHVAAQPFMGIVLNVFNRHVIPNIDALRGYELFANLMIAVLGLVIVVAVARTRPE